ncbi:MAG TPA: response regulator [Saprospiraceae bacterium]|nr:response regulator [Saprospiraceae bacterium]
MTKRLLLVEDHEDLRRTIGSYFSEHFTVLSAKNGVEAMGVLSKGIIPDVIVTDSSMPEMDGATLLHHLRNSGWWADIPVFVLGANETDSEAQYFERLGAHGYFAKPFSPVKLKEQIMNLIP